MSSWIDPADSPSCSPIAPMAHGDLHQLALPHLQTHLPIKRHDGLRVLDLGAGSGSMSQLMHTAGYGVEACDLEPSLFRYPAVTCRQADLADRLPYDDASFDGVVCVEVLEHLDGHEQLFREVQRVLKPGGVFLFTTPNVMSIKSRLSFLWTGFEHSFYPLEVGDQSAQEWHISGHGGNRYRFVLGLAGLELRKIACDKLSRTSLVFAWLAPLIWLRSWLRHHGAAGARFNNSPAALFGRTMIGVAMKRDAAYATAGSPSSATLGHPCSQTFEQSSPIEGSSEVSPTRWRHQGTQLDKPAVSPIGVACATAGDGTEFAATRLSTACHPTRREPVEASSAELVLGVHRGVASSGTRTPDSVANKLTVIIPCKDERENIRACVVSAQQVADEVLVADSGSTDGTLAIARQLGCRVIERDYRTSGDFKNWAIPQAAHEWVLILDADERVTPVLAAEIRSVLAAPQHDGYWIYRRNHFLGHPIRFGPWKNDRCLRLFRRELSRYVGPTDHAEVELRSGSVGRLHERMTHYTCTSYAQYLPKLARYADVQSRVWHRDGRRTHAGHLLLRFPLRFLQGYVWRLGFFDGLAGLQVCVLVAYLSYLKHAYLWQLQNGRDRQILDEPLSSDSSESADRAVA